MPTNIKDYSTTQASNTSLNGISTAEGMLPSNLNNAIRALMKNTRDWFNDAQWIEYGDGDGAFTAAYASATSFTIAGVDVTSIYHAGRRIKLTATTPGTIFGTIASSSFSTNTTINVTWDSGSLANEAITHVYIGALSKTNSSIPTEIIGTSNISDSAVTTAKIAADAVNGTKIADDSINSEHYVDGSIDTAHIADAQITTAKITDANVTTAKIAADAVDGTKIADDSINSEHYVDGSIDTAHIADSQITTAKIADSAITSAKINDGAIVNADINASAAIATANIQDSAINNAKISSSADIDATKIHDGTISNTEFGYLNGVSSNIQDQLDAKGASNANLTAIGALATTDGNFIVGSGSTWVAETGSTARASLGLGTISTQAANSVAITGGTITGLGAPSSGSDAATKTYVDDLVTGLKTRIITRAATTANITLSSDLQNGDTLDGVTLATGNKVLVKDQTDATENGIYNVVASGTATRDTDYDTVAELAGQLVIVQEGSTNADKIFLCTTDNSGSIGSVNIVFTIVQPSNVGDVTLTGTQTLTNKTLTSPKINEDVAVTATATEINLIDGGASIGTDAIADGDGIIHNDGGTMKVTSAATFKTYFTSGVSSAADDLTAGDAAVNLTTTSGNITIDAQAGDSDIIFKGTDSSSDITALTLDMSDAGTAVFNHDIKIADDGQIGSASAADAMIISSGGIVTFKDDILIKDGGTIGVASTADALTISSAGIVTFKDDILIKDGGTIGSASDADSITIASNGVVTFSQAPVFPDGSIAVADLDIDGATDIGADLVDADLFIVDDGAGGTNRKVAASRIKTYIGGGTQWQSVKTSNYTATAGQGVFMNTTSGALTLTLPASPSIGDEVTFVDYAGTFDSNNLTIARNSSKIHGAEEDLTVAVERAANTLVFTDSTQGWLLKSK